MASPSAPLVVVPSRLASTRLPLLRTELGL